MNPGMKRVVGVGCVVLLMAYAVFLVIFFKTLPARLAASNDIRSKVKWTARFSPSYGVRYQISDQGNIYSLAYGGSTSCWDQDGNQVWNSTPPQAPNTFYSILGFDTFDDGRVIALIDQPSHSTASPGMHLSASIGKVEFQIIDSSGAVVKQQSLPMLTSVDSIQTTSDRLYVLDSADVVHAFDLDGNLMWQDGTAPPSTLNAPVNRGNYSYTSGNPVSRLAVLPVSKKIIRISIGGHISVLNPDGTVHAQEKTGTAIQIPHFAVGMKDELYLADLELRALDLDCNTLWKVPLSNPNLAINAMALGSDGAIYINQYDYTSSNAEIVCYEPNGNQRWQNTVSNQSTLLAVANDGTVYTAGSTCGLYSIDPLGNLNWHLQYKAFYIQNLGVTPNGTVIISDYHRTIGLNP